MCRWAVANSRSFAALRKRRAGNIIFGISDEESRLNLNVATTNQLTNFTGMTPEIGSAIMTWRNAANTNDNHPLAELIRIIICHSSRPICRGTARSKPCGNF